MVFECLDFVCWGQEFDFMVKLVEFFQVCYELFMGIEISDGCFFCYGQCQGLVVIVLEYVICNVICYGFK